VIVLETKGAEVMSYLSTIRSPAALAFNLWLRRCFIGGLAILISTLSFAQESQLDTSMRQFLNNPDSPIVVRGDYLKALLSAYEDFAKTLKRNGVHAGTPGSENPQLARQLSKIDAYDIQLEQRGETYLVHFGPTIRDQAHVVFGGGVTYTVRRRDFKIVDKTLTK